MNKTLTTLIAGVMLAGAAAPAAAVEHGQTPAQLCVEDTDGLWFAYQAETAEDWTWIGQRRVESFPNTVHGCASFGPLKTAPALPAADTCDPVEVPVEVVRRVVRVQAVEVPVEVVRTVEVPVEVVRVDTRLVDKLRAKVQRQRQRIAKLKAATR